MRRISERILIVSDDGPSAALRQSLVAREFEVNTTQDADDGYQKLTESPFDLAIISLDDVSAGLDLIKRIRSNSNLGGLLILTTAEWGTGQPTLALTQGADAFEPKPIDGERLTIAVEKLVRPNLVMSAKASVAERDAED